MQHRSKLSHQCTQLRNKLTAICDELFPEFTQIFHDPNREVALAFREKFPTPHEMVTASLATLRELRHRNFPSEANLLRLQQLARETIGITNVDRLRGLKLEQELLTKELRLVQEHLERLDTEIADIVKSCREGQILLSLMATRSTTFECEWARIYQRLLPRLGTYDERIKDYRGKKKVLGRITGQMASMIFALLKTDQETLS
jgi:hypothetical protein